MEVRTTQTKSTKVPDGFKQTEAGVIPEDWEVKSFDDCGRFFKGKGIRKAEVKNEGIPCVRYGELYTKYDNIIKETHSFISDEVASQSIKLKFGDLLFAGSGETKSEIGKSAAILREDTYAGGDIVVFRAKNINPVFLGFLSNSIPVSKQKTLNGQGDAVVHIYSSGISKIKIPLPPTLTEQKAIASALSDVDGLIASLAQLIEKKKAIKQGAMQELLTPPSKGGKRLPGFSGEWVEKNIGNIGNTFGGLSGKTKKDFESGNYPYITFLNVMNNTVIDTSIFQYVNIHPGEQQNKARKGDLFFNTSSETPEEVGMCAVLNEDFEALYLNSFCFGFRLKEDIEIEALFFSYLINSSIGRNLFLSLAQGATRYNLSKSNFNKLVINIPSSKEEQTAIAQILSDMDLEIEQLEEKKEKYGVIKVGMMQELLTGRTRLV